MHFSSSLFDKISTNPSSEMDWPIFFFASFQVARASLLGSRSPGPGFANTQTHRFDENLIYISLVFDGVQTEEEWKIWMQNWENFFLYLCQDPQRNCCWLESPCIWEASSCRDQDRWRSRNQQEYPKEDSQSIRIRKSPSRNVDRCRYRPEPSLVLKHSRSLRETHYPLREPSRHVDQEFHDPNSALDRSIQC